MKTNKSLHDQIGFQNAAQKALYTANVLMAGLSNSPAIKVKDAVVGVPGKAAIPPIYPRPARPASLPVAGVDNPGYLAGELYFGSPLYKAGTPIPAIAAIAAVLAVPGVDAVPAILPKSAISSPAVVALKGWGDAIDIKTVIDGSSVERIEITAELPIYQGAGIQGSGKVVIGEITPSALQATAFVDPGGMIYTLGQDPDITDNIADTTLEQVFYRMALLCDHTVTDTVKIVDGINVNCKKLVVIVYPGRSYQPDNDFSQLADIRLLSGGY